MSNDIESSTMRSPLVNEASSDDDAAISTVEWLTMFMLYALVSFKFLLAVAVGAVVVSNSGFSHFALHTGPGLAIYIISIILWFINPCCLIGCRNVFPCNCLTLLLWPVSFAFAVGFSCSYSNGNGRGKTVLEAIILMSVVAVSLTLYSLVAMIKRAKFNLHPLFILTFFLLICVYVPIQIYQPFAKLSTSIWGFVAALFFWANAYYTGSNIKRFESIVPSPVYARLHSTFVATSSS
ncbi:Bax inhibitor 1-related protein [Corchorus olitorius]|uniref:Bax inhibitor 1-related protein n=1 Tax=Corchorus olitorius TaxID=93759 RepID=A0A1R3IEK3_9ROSI|nr:Bax inhibitor 1-related protein [Corchorus olitorius]